MLRKVFLSLISLCAQVNTEPRNLSALEDDLLLLQGVPLAVWWPNVGILLSVLNLTETSMWQLKLSTEGTAQEKVTGSFVSTVFSCFSVYNKYIVSLILLACSGFVCIMWC